MLKEFQRALSEKERRTLRRRLFSAKRLRETLPLRSISPILILVGVISVLSVLTKLASKESWIVVGCFWVVVGLGVAAYAFVSEQRRLARLIYLYEDCLSRDKANVVRIQCSEVVEFEEFEDEGALYAFQIDEEEIIFVAGQEFYSTNNFPNTDFELVSVFDGNGALLQHFILNLGKKLAPSRRVSSQLKQRLASPEHLDRRPGKLADLEKILTHG